MMRITTCVHEDRSSSGRTWFAVLVAAIGLAAISGCAGESSSAAPVDRALVSIASDDVPDVLATIGDEAITMDDVRQRVGADLDQIEVNYQRQKHRAIETTLRGILRERVLLAEAEKQGKSPEQLIAAEAGGTLEPSEIEIRSWYDENRARTGGRTLDQVRVQIADHLRNERREAAAESLERRLNEERRVAVHYEPYRLRFNNDGAPSLGPDDAPVTLVEFSDFECPFCNRFHPTLRQLEQNYGDRLRIVYRQYPIPSIHPNAFKASEASLCAHEQGKFWDLHDLMFQEQRQLTVRDLKDKAARVGLDRQRFDACLDSGRYVEQVQVDIAEASRSGVNGTPALFVNGVPIDGGAVAYEVVAKAIDRELARLGR